jgi:hypothetical protein
VKDRSRAHRRSWTRLVLFGIALALVGGALALAAVPAHAIETSDPFTDFHPGDPYFDAVYYLWQEKIVSGYAVPGGFAFGPHDNVKRAQFAKIIDGALKIAVTTDLPDPPFTDLDPIGSDGLYPHKYVYAAWNAQITTGKTPTSFDPYGDVTRVQVISMVVRAVENHLGWTLKDPDAKYWQTGAFRNFDDPVHGRNVHEAEYQGLLAGINGDNLQNWDLWAPASRGECAQIVYNMMEKFGTLETIIHLKADGSGDFPSLESAVAAADPGTIIMMDTGTYPLSSPLVIDKALIINTQSVHCSLPSKTNTSCIGA